MHNSDVIPLLPLYPAGQIVPDINRKRGWVEFIQHLSRHEL